MCGLRTSFCLAKKMDKGLGTSKILLSQMSQQQITFLEMIMARPLPFTAITDTGDKFDVDFPLHEATEAPMRVHQLLEDILAVVSREARRDGMANGDVLQACAMALAIRARVIVADPEVTTNLAKDLTLAALEAVQRADVSSPPSGLA